MYCFTRVQEGGYSELLKQEGGGLAHLMEAFAEDGSEAEETNGGKEVCVCVSMICGRVDSRCGVRSYRPQL